jgi:hypothetical protein
MKLFLFLIATTVCTNLISQPDFGQTENETYPETRKLLLKMERKSDNKALKKLFELGEARISDFKKALYDPEQKVSLNSQIIIKYLGDPEGVAEVEEWIKYNRQQGKQFATPIFTPPPDYKEGKFLVGKDKDLTKLVLNNWPFTSDAVRKVTAATMIAYNKQKNKALIDVTENCIPLCGACWYVTLKKEGDRWRYLSAFLVWQS